MKKNLLQHLILISVLTLLCNKLLYAQDPNFSQFYNQPIQNNPALVGINDGLRIGALYRNLWTKVPGKFNTFDCAADVEALNYGGGLGIVASSDLEGEGYLTTQSIGGAYAYRITLKPRDFIVQVGFQTTVFTQRLDFSKLVFADQLDARYGLITPTNIGTVPTPDQSKSFVDFSVGSAMVKNFYFRKMNKRYKITSNFAIAFHHITSPDQSLMGVDAKLPIKFSSQGNVIIPFNYSLSGKYSGLLVPAFLFEAQDKFRQVVVGVNAVKSPIFGGLFFRSRSLPGLSKDVDALVADIGLEVPMGDATLMKVCYSYDITINKLGSSAPGAHEIGLFFWFKDIYMHKNKNSNKRMNCFSF